MMYWNVDHPTSVDSDESRVYIFPSVEFLGFNTNNCLPPIPPIHPGVVGPITRLSLLDLVIWGPKIHTVGCPGEAQKPRKVRHVGNKSGLGASRF